jgi:hypothetical protein
MNDIQSAAFVEVLDAEGAILARVAARNDIESIRLSLSPDEARRCASMRLIGRDGVTLGELPSRNSYLVDALERDVAQFLAGGLPVDAEEFMRYARARIEALPGIAEAEGVDVQDGNTDRSKFYSWVRLCDGAGGCFDFDLSAQQGKRVSFGVVAGA